MKHWIEAARPRTLPLALASIILGSFLAASYGAFCWLIFGFTILTTILLQILSNFANDYGDTQNGADSIERKGPKRAVQSGEISKLAMLKAIIFLAVLSLISGVYLLFLAFGSFNSQYFYRFLGIGFLSIVAAITYTAGKKPYGYAGLGDLSVLIFFGLVGVLGTFFLQAKFINYILILPALTSGLFAVTVLNINNLRDIDSDRLAGKKTIPVRFGKAFGINYHQSIIVLGFIASAIYGLVHNFSLFKLWPIICIPMLYNIFYGIKIEDTPQKIDTFLKKMALTSLFFSIIFGIGEYLS